FHELARLGAQMPRLCPHTMRVKEWKGTVVFLHEVAEGSARRSWGVHVAELAGVPAQVVRRAAALMTTLEKQGGMMGSAMSTQALPLFAAAAEPEVTIAPAKENGVVCQALHDVNLDTLSPKQALDVLYHLKSLTPTCAPGAR
ncbi:MAG: MutS-related protein, partial [Rhodopila sp.]